MTKKALFEAIKTINELTVKMQSVPAESKEWFALSELQDSYLDSICFVPAWQRWYSVHRNPKTGKWFVRFD